MQTFYFCVKKMKPVLGSIKSIKVKLAFQDSCVWVRTLTSCSVSTEVLCVRSDRSDQRSHHVFVLSPEFSGIMWCSVQKNGVLPLHRWLESDIPQQQGTVTAVTSGLHTAHNHTTHLSVQGWRNVIIRFQMSDASCWWTWATRHSARRTSRDFWVTTLKEKEKT